VVVLKELVVEHRAWRPLVVPQTVRLAAAAAVHIVAMLRQSEDRVPVAEPAEQPEVPEVALQAVPAAAVAAMQAEQAEYKPITVVQPAAVVQATLAV
jgi:hypothetical protein